MQAKPRILLVNDQTDQLRSLQQMLHDRAEVWELLTAEGGQQALEVLVTQPVDVVVAAMHMKAMTGAELLQQVAISFPRTIRFIVCKPEDKDIVSQSSGDLHQVLSEPLEAETLRSRLERTLAINQWLQSDSVKEMVSKMRTFRSLPSLYLEVMKELQSPNASAAAVGEIIAKDLAMTAKLLQVVNSVFFGLQQRVNSPSEAVFILGLDTVRSLVLSVHAYAELDKVKPLYFSTDKLWRHSMAVAHRAKKLAQRVTNDEKIADEAYTAGLFHDIGKIVLASNMADTYNGGLALAKKRQIPVCEVEAELFGATHAETGAYLLGLWGLPVPILEAIALHHAPLRSNTTEFTPLTAVHVADVLEHEEHPGQDDFVHPTMDLEYLRRLGLENELEEWRGTVPEKPAPSASSSTASATPTIRYSTPPLSPATSARVHWMVWPVLAVLTITLVSWWTYLIASRQPTPMSARVKTSTRSDDRPVPLKTPSATKPVEPASTGPSRSPLADVKAVTPAPAPVNGHDDTESLAEFRLQGIFYRKSNPSAVINGKTVHRGDRIGGAKVVSIGRDSVKLDRNGETTVLVLK